MAASGDPSSAGTRSSAVEEASASLAELISHLTAASAETHAIDRLRAAKSKLHSELSRCDASAAETVRALSVRVGTKIEDASRDAELRRAREELAEAHKAAHALDREVSRLRGDRVVAEDQVADIEARAEAVNSRLEAARNSEAAAAPTLRHKLRLLVLIAPVKWDLDAPAGTLRGLVAPAAGQGVPATFSVDSSAKSATEAADDLWAAVDSACSA